MIYFIDPATYSNTICTMTYENFCTSISNTHSQFTTDRNSHNHHYFHTHPNLKPIATISPVPDSAAPPITTALPVSQAITSAHTQTLTPYSNSNYAISISSTLPQETSISYPQTEAIKSIPRQTVASSHLQFSFWKNCNCTTAIKTVVAAGVATAGVVLYAISKTM